MQIMGRASRHQTDKTSVTAGRGKAEWHPRLQVGPVSRIHVRSVALASLGLIANQHISADCLRRRHTVTIVSGRAVNALRANPWLTRHLSDAKRIRTRALWHPGLVWSTCFPRQCFHTQAGIDFCLNWLRGFERTETCKIGQPSLRARSNPRSAENSRWFTPKISA
jgi:hypothetical protein